MSIRAEGTIGRLRYPLGGDRPSQTAHLAPSPSPSPGSRLEPHPHQGGIPPAAPPDLAARLPSLPPILYRSRQGPMPGYSQAPRGLSVQSRVPRIFTRPSISPGPPPRQRPSRYTFRAGRNLPDKEFRYLRTVIVTAAVHWGFGSALTTPPLHRPAPGRCQPLYLRSTAFAETCVFGKQSLGPFPCNPLGLPTLPGPPFSRSYGGFLPSSLARVLPRALGSSPRLPVSASVRAQVHSLAAFPGSPDSATSVLPFPRHHRSGSRLAVFPTSHPRQLARALPSARCAYPPASPLRSYRTPVVPESPPVPHRLRPPASA